MELSCISLGVQGPRHLTPLRRFWKKGPILPIEDTLGSHRGRKGPMSSRQDLSEDGELAPSFDECHP